MPALAERRQRWAALPNHTDLVDVDPAPAGTRRVAIHRLESGEHSRTIVCLHGMLADYRSWRFVAGDLASDASVWLVDLPGAGLSDAPPPTRQEPLDPSGAPPGLYGYTVTEMARDVLTALAASENQAGPITIVAHSYGGQVALRLMSDPSLPPALAAVRSRVDSLVLIAPLDIHVHAQNAEMRRMATASSLEYALAEWTGELDRIAYARTRGSVSAPTPALLEEAGIRRMYLADPARRAAAQAVLSRAVPWAGPQRLRPDWARIEEIESWYSSIAAPTLILWGRRDEVLPVSMGYKLAAELPRARLVTWPGVMHSPQIERPGETAALIRQFIAELDARSDRGALAPGMVGHDAHAQP